MVKNYHIGCSGYYYPKWKNIFYPEEVKQKDWLAYYSTVFNAVELNGTFYKVPVLSALKKQADSTSKEFRFAVKMNKFITHNKKLNDSKQTIIEFQNLVIKGLGDKLSCFLFQMPPSFHYNEENLSRILKNIPYSSENVVEFRHASWWNEDVEKKFKKARLTFCNVDFPELKSFVINTSPLFYLRLHGSPLLFISSYSKKQLESFYDSFPEKCKDINIFFNNSGGGAAVENAEELKK